jgi:hypothetical protein
VPALAQSGRLGALARSPWLRAAVALLVLLAWGWFLQGQLEALRAYEWRLAPLAFAAAVGWGALYFAGLAVSWTLLLRTTGGAARRVALADGARIWTGTMLSRYLPGNIWHIVGRVALAGSLGVSRAQVAASATVEQLLTLLGALALFALSLPFWRGGAGPEAWLLLLVPFGLAFLHPRALGALLAAAATRLRRPELAWQYRYGELLRILGAYTLANLAAGLALWVTLGALAPVEPGQLAFVAGAAAAAWAAGYLSFLTPSGLGVREAALAAMLAQAYPLPAAVVGSLVYRLALTLGELVAAGAALLLAGRRGASAAGEGPKEPV